jgi:hypothetical protein
VTFLENSVAGRFAIRIPDYNREIMMFTLRWLLSHLVRRNNPNFAARYPMRSFHDKGGEATPVAVWRRKDRLNSDERFRSEVENLSGKI